MSAGIGVVTGLLCRGFGGRLRGGLPGPLLPAIDAGGVVRPRARRPRQRCDRRQQPEGCRSPSARAARRGRPELARREADRQRGARRASSGSRRIRPSPPGGRSRSRDRGWPAGRARPAPPRPSRARRGPAPRRRATTGREASPRRAARPSGPTTSRSRTVRVARSSEDAGPLARLGQPLPPGAGRRAPGARRRARARAARIVPRR